MEAELRLVRVTDDECLDMHGSGKSDKNKSLFRTLFQKVSEIRLPPTIFKIARTIFRVIIFYDFAVPTRQNDALI